MFVSNRSTRTLSRPSRQGGFTLVELMISLVISLMVGLAALSAAQFFMSMQRQSAGLSAATANLVTAFATVKFEAGQAGMGFFNDKGALACSSLNVSNGATVVHNGDEVRPIGLTVSDARVPTLDLYYATELAAVSAAGLAGDAVTSDQSSAQISTYLPAVAAQDVLLVPITTSPAPCSLRTVTNVASVTTPSGPQQVLTFGASGVHNQGTFSTTPAANKYSVMLLGTLRSARFTLAKQNVSDETFQLVMTRPFETVGQAVMSKNVVAMVVQYGVSDPGGAGMSGWRYPKNYPSLAGGAVDWSNITSATLVSQVKALRIAVLVRSAQKDKRVNGACATTASMPSLLGVPLGQPLPATEGTDLTETVSAALTGDWACYRYAESRVVIPLSNLTLGSQT